MILPPVRAPRVIDLELARTRRECRQRARIERRHAATNPDRAYVAELATVLANHIDIGHPQRNGCPRAWFRELVAAIDTARPVGERSAAVADIHRLRRLAGLGA